MSTLDYQDPIISKRRKGTSDDPFVPYSITFQIVNSKVVLPEKPNKFERVKVTSTDGTETLYEVSNGNPTTNEYYVDYVNQVVHLHSSRNLSSMVFTFKGEGLQYIPDSLVYTKSDGTQVTENLSQHVTNAKTEIDQKVATSTADAQSTIDTANTKITEMDGKISEANVVIDEGTTATQNANSATTSANDATTKANEAYNNLNLDWQSPVASKADLPATPSHGWAAHVHSDVTASNNGVWRYDSTLAAWEKVHNLNITGYSNVSDLDTVDQAKANLIRNKTHSGFVNLSPITYLATTANTIRLAEQSVAYVDGYEIVIPANTDFIADAPPTFGDRFDLFYLQSTFGTYSMSWTIEKATGKSTLEEVGFTQDTVDKGLWKNGTLYAIPMFKIPRRNSGGYRVDNDNGARDYSKQSITSPTTTTTVTVGSTIQVGVSDTSLFYVKDTLSRDGVPNSFEVISIDSSTLMTIKNIHTSNVNIGTINTLETSIPKLFHRPDSLYSNIIDSNDIKDNYDLRHQIYLSGVDKNYLLNKEFDRFKTGEGVAEELTKEQWNLQKAPLGLKQELVVQKVKGNDGVERELVNEMGTEGGFHKQGKWGSALTIDTASYKFGTSSGKIDNSAGTAQKVSQNNQKMYLQGKYVLVGWWMKSASGTPEIDAYLLEYDSAGAGVSTSLLMTTTITNGWKFYYKKINLTAQSGAYYNARVDVNTFGTADDVVNFDGLSIYLIDQATYDKIDVSSDFTGEELAKKFPYVDSYPNFVENLIPPFSDLAWTLHANAKVDDPYKLTLNATASAQLSYVDVSCVAGQVYTISVGSMTSSNQILKVQWYDSSNVATTLKDSNGSTYSFTAPSGAVKIRITLYSTASGTFVFTNPQMEAGSATNPFVPFGRYYLPTDYANGASKYKITESLSGQRSIFSDAQTSETRYDKIEVSKTPQKHVTVTQATEGTWAINDTIKVKSYYGMVGGVNAELAKILNTDSAGLNTLDDASNLATNDVVNIANDDLTITNSGVYVKVIDATANTVEFYSDSGLTTKITNDLTGKILVETSTASPVVTADGITGTWTNLGTKEATFTISGVDTTTYPGADKTNILIKYSVNYPSGRGIQYLPSEVLEAKVNGQRLIKGQTVSAKANFEGKVSGNTDLVAHVAYRLGGTASPQTSLATPSNLGNLIEASSGLYPGLDAIGGTQLNSTTSHSTSMAQHLLSFNLIRLAEDKYGEGFFAYCLTVADKVAKLETDTTKIAGIWHGRGTSPTGDKATYLIWDGANWVNPVNHTSASTTKLTNAVSSNIANYIDANGFVHFLAHAEASDGSVASTVYSDYIECEVTLNVSESGYEVFQPSEKMPVLSENLLSSNQAFPVDLADFTSGNGTTITVDSVGVIKAVNDGSQVDQGFYFNNWSLKANTYYTMTFDVKLTSGDVLEASAYSAGLYGTKTSTGNGDWQKVSVTFKHATGTTTRFYLIVDGTKTATFYMRNAKLQEGSFVTPWSKGRNKKKILNTLGKTIGGTENPHKAFYKALDTFGAPSTFTTEYTQTNYDNLSKQDGVLTTQPTAPTDDQYDQRLQVYDFSHYNMSLSELKSNLRKLTVSNTLYGKGTNYIDDPTVAPTVTAITDADTTTVLDAGTYYVAYKWINANGETAYSPESTAVTVDGATQAIQVDLPAFPSNVTEAHIYIGTVAGSTKYNQYYARTTTTTAYVDEPYDTSWIGADSNDSGTTVYGATVKIWNASTSAWGDTVTGTASSPETLTKTLTANLGDYITNDQKMYVLAHATYPSNSGIVSTTYVDYGKCEVEMSDQIDYVKSNILLVQKETKQIKIKYPTVSHRNGQQDVVEIFYKHKPKPTNLALGTVTELTKPTEYIISTVGTGAYNTENNKLISTILDKADSYLGQSLHTFITKGLKKLPLETDELKAALPDTNYVYVAMTPKIVLKDDGQLYMRIFYKESKDNSGLVFMDKTFDLPLSNRPLLKGVN
jgi:hypothetical protein